MKDKKFWGGWGWVLEGLVVGRWRGTVLKEMTEKVRGISGKGRNLMQGKIPRV